MSESEIRPTLHNVQETSNILNSSTQELNQLVQKVSDFSGETVDQITFFRNQLAGLLTNTISLRHGIRAGWSHFVSRIKEQTLRPRQGDPPDNRDKMTEEHRH